MQIQWRGIRAFISIPSRANEQSAPDRLKGRLGKALKLLGLAGAGLSVLIGGLAGIGLYLNSPPAAHRAAAGESLRVEADGTVYIEVTGGESAIAVGRRLKSAGLIRSPLFWNILFKLHKEYIKTGMYRFKFPLAQTRIRSVLVSGKQILHRVTLPGGVTLKKAAKILAAAGICTEEAFLQAAADRELLDYYHIPGDTMEGYIYPDTYFFPAPYPPRQAVKTMGDTFFRRLEEFQGAAAGLDAGELNKRIILASIVEREYRVDAEAPLMAGVFYNRLKIGMALQSCATVEYVITEIQGRPHPQVLYDRDTAIQNPYNTYIQPGLPPGPIASPGPAALNAAFNPASSEYLYFRLVNPEEGRHYFSKTLDEHIQAGALYVKGSLP
ncbi:MAG: endolytic transglycosylase MltG [Treponema sp.]|jgi:UPF0755 protein|nr:endolytic transglycosylase MltG [Treponema sp.]